MTNGSGMVQFSRGFMRFGKTLPIVPVALRVTVPWNIQTHTLTSSFVANLFWFCFVPWVQLDATVLKPMSLAQVRTLDSLLLLSSAFCKQLLHSIKFAQNFCSGALWCLQLHEP